MKQPPTIICLMGPTASGKTQLAIDLVQQLPCEIISVDSAMVYRGMDIGTAKPDQATLALAPHRLLDIRDPADSYSAAQFRSDALHEIAAIIANDKIPLLVGGTMMYFNVLQQGLSELPEADAATREKIAREVEEYGWPGIHAKLQQIDATAAARIHQHDKKRLQRALEVYYLTGKTITAWQTEDAPRPPSFNMINLALAPLDRAILHERIAQRFHAMLAAGFVAEVESLMQRGDLTLETPAMRAVGYRQVWEYLQGKYTYEEMCAKGIAATRQLAKRQLTWLRNWSTPVNWLDSLATDLVAQALHVI